MSPTSYSYHHTPHTHKDTQDKQSTANHPNGHDMLCYTLRSATRPTQQAQLGLDERKNHKQRDSQIYIKSRQSPSFSPVITTKLSYTRYHNVLY